MQLLNLDGVGVCAVSMAETLDEIDGWIERDERRYICTVNVHSLVEGWGRADIRHALNGADLSTADGMPIVWLMHRAGFPAAERIAGPDLMSAVVERGLARGYGHFFYGSTAETLLRLTNELRERFPGIRISGTLAPPFRRLDELQDGDDAAAIDEINGSGADVLWVGLGAPKQELWMSRHRDEIATPTMIGVGAAFDMHAGLVRRASPMLQNLGLEWAHRLALEPRRLWKRYLVSNTFFLAALAGEKVGLRRFEPVERLPH